MTSPALDAGAHAKVTIDNWSGSNSFTNSSNIFATSGANEVAISVVTYEGMSSTGSMSTFSVTDGSTTLTFAKRFSVQGGSGSSRQTIEVWWAQVASQFNVAAATVTISATFSVSLDDACMTLFAVSGVGSVSAPWDNDVSIPTGSVNTTSTFPPTQTFSTSQADDFILFVSAIASGTFGTDPAGYTNISQVFNGGGGGFESHSVCYKTVSSTQTLATVANSSLGTSSSWASSVDALTADIPAAPSAGSAALNIGVAGFGNALVPTAGAIGLNLAVAGTEAALSRGAGSIGVNIAPTGFGIGIHNSLGSIGLNISPAGTGASRVASTGSISLDIALLGRGVNAPKLLVPVFSIMRNSVIPAIGDMDDATIACQGRFY